MYNILAVLLIQSYFVAKSLVIYKFASHLWLYTKILETMSPWPLATVQVQLTSFTILREGLYTRIIQNKYSILQLYIYMYLVSPTEICHENIRGDVSAAPYRCPFYCCGNRTYEFCCSNCRNRVYGSCVIFYVSLCAISITTLLIVSIPYPLHLIMAPAAQTAFLRPEHRPSNGC